MTSPATPRDPAADHLLTAQNAALLIIDYQPVQVTSVASMDRREMVANVVAVTKLAKLFAMPIVLSTVNVKTGKNAPTIHQLQDILGGVESYDRTTINAWEDAQFLAAVKATGRKKLLICALWTEACALHSPHLTPSATATRFIPLIDAVGGTSLKAHDAALVRMTQAGARPVSWVQLARANSSATWNRAATAGEIRQRPLCRRRPLKRLRGLA